VIAIFVFDHNLII